MPRNGRARTTARRTPRTVLTAIAPPTKISVLMMAAWANTAWWKYRRRRRLPVTWPSLAKA